MENAISNRVKESSLLKLDPNEKLKLDERNSIIFNCILTSAKTIIEKLTKTDAYMKSTELEEIYHQYSSIKIMSLIVTKLTNAHSFIVNRDLSSNIELANKNHVGDSKGDGNNLRFNETLDNFSKVSVGNDTYNITKHDIIQVTDRTIFKSGNSGVCLLT